MPTETLLGAGLVFAVCVILMLALPPLAHRLELVDKPSRRKLHAGPVPVVGGLGMFLAFCLGLAVLELEQWPVASFLTGAGILVVTGMLDDHRELSSVARFIAQIFAAAVMVEGAGVQLHQLGPIFWPETATPLHDFSLPLTIFATVGVINALNMVDGVDGLAGSVSLLATLAMALLASLAGDQTSASLLLLLAAAIAAFLLFNWRFTASGKAKVFMGDTGSLFLGFTLCWFFIELTQGEAPAMTPVTALWLFAVPLIDTVTMMLRRLLKGLSPFQADREHFHHLLLLAGFSDRETVLVILGVSAVACAIGVAGYWLQIPEYLLFYLFALAFVGYFLVIRHAWRFMRLMKERLQPGDSSEFYQ